MLYTQLHPGSRYWTGARHVEVKRVDIHKHYDGGQNVNVLVTFINEDETPGQVGWLRPCDIVCTAEAHDQMLRAQQERWEYLEKIEAEIKALGVELHEPDDGSGLTIIMEEDELIQCARFLAKLREDGGER
jgi:hypothetical protein